MGCPRIDTGNFLSLLKVAYKRLSVVEKSGQGGTKEGINFCVSSTNYKYQGQELQETGFYSFKWRNYDPSIGRFLSIDPLSEKFPYNSTYAFQENKLGMGREFEGLELVPFEFLMMSNSSMNLQFLL